MYKKVGFKDVGRLRDMVYIKGSYHDVMLMDITKEEFKSSAYNEHIRLDCSDIEI